MSTSSMHGSEMTAPTKPAGQSLRIFVAIALGADVKASLDRVVDRLRQTGAAVTWVRPANLHLSLAFLGAVDASDAPRVCALVDAAAAEVEPFVIEVAGLGSFGPPRAPRVIWAGVRAGPELAELQRRIATGLTGDGIRLDAKPFHPHITLGRVRAPSRCDRLMERVRQGAGLAFGTVPVTTADVMQSELRPEGAAYALLHASPLAALVPGRALR